MTGAIVGSISPEATKPFGNISADAMRGIDARHGFELDSLLWSSRRHCKSEKAFHTPWWQSHALRNRVGMLVSVFFKIDFSLWACRFVSNR